MDNTITKTTELKLSDVTDLEVDGINPKDYPDFSDAYFASGWNLKEDRECTDEELDYLTDAYSDMVNEMAHERY